MDNPIKSPVALFVFNRPDVTRRVFEQVRMAKPENLFVVVDGPRNEADKQKTDQVKKIVENVDWKCQVFKNYSDTNMGCDVRIATGINWVFQNVDRAIFLEDDCLPHPSFFRFCDELLEKYKNDPKIMHISGDNFQHENKKFICNESYYFSRISQSWGWATWKRAWLLQDKDMKRWPETKSSNLLGKIFHDKAIVAYWEDLLQKFYDKKRINWDGQWTFACFVNNGLCIMPKVNLISNIGFGDGATHTRQHNHKFSNLPVSAIKFPLTHPDKKMVNHQAEDYTMKWFFGVNESWKQRVKWYIKSLFPVPYNFLKRIYHKNQ